MLRPFTRNYETADETTKPRPRLSASTLMIVNPS